MSCLRNFDLYSTNVQIFLHDALVIKTFGTLYEGALILALALPSTCIIKWDIVKYIMLFWS